MRSQASGQRPAGRQPGPGPGRLGTGHRGRPGHAPLSQMPAPVGTVVGPGQVLAPLPYAPARPARKFRWRLLRPSRSRIRSRSAASRWPKCRLPRASPAPGSTTRRCPAMRGPATRRTRTMPPSPIRDSTRQPPGPTSDRSIRIPRSPWDGGRSPWNGMTAGGGCTSRASNRLTAVEPTHSSSPRTRIGVRGAAFSWPPPARGGGTAGRIARGRHGRVESASITARVGRVFTVFLTRPEKPASRPRLTR